MGIRDRFRNLKIQWVLGRHPAVSECAVLAEPDRVGEQVLEAFVVLREGYGPSGELTAELQDLVKGLVGAREYPRRVHYVNELPKNRWGWVERFQLRQRLREGKFP